MKLSLNKKILLWFLIIILVSFILYSSLIYFVYQFHLKGEYYFRALRENPDLDHLLLPRLKEMEEFGPHRRVADLTILPPGLFMKVFFSITGGVLVIIIIAASGGFLFLKRMLNQVNLITKNVKEIDDRRLHLRLNLKGKDSISNMARTFDNMLDKIEASFKSHKQFIQNASHELNTPLTVVKTKIDVLMQKKAVTNKEYRETMEIIDSEIMRLSKITEDLLLLSDLEDNGKKAEFNRIDIKTVLKKMVKLFENQIDSKDLKLKLSFDGKSRILGNQTQIEQLIFNLMDNAIKYSISEEELIIGLNNDREEKYLIIETTNTSEAIGKEEIPNIFKRFYKSSKGTTVKGFGLGLAIAKKIVENHGGAIRANYDKDTKQITFKTYLLLLEKKE